MENISRRTVIRQLGLLGLATTFPFSAEKNEMIMRKIPKSDESLPCVGLGTWRTFDVGSGDQERRPLQQVVKNLAERGARVIDSSPMYGNSESVVGDLSTRLNVNNDLFLATKVWTNGEAEGKRQMENSLSLLGRKQIDLMQIHNLVDWRTHLKTLRDWKEQGRIRYIGITHYLDSEHPTMETILKNNPIDFIQVNYSLRSRNAAESLLPAAADNNIAVIINRPFEEGALFDLVQGRALPEWVKEIDCSNWAQVFLKFILSHPAVTCAIPGTSNPSHLIENIGAASGKLPDERQRLKMIQLLS
jgi:diketogulonate reductase-like aldo/keto reductase